MTYNYSLFTKRIIYFIHFIFLSFLICHAMKRAHLIKNYYRKFKRKILLLQLHLMSQVVQIKISAVQKILCVENMLSAVKWKRKRSFFANECATKINLQKEFLFNCFFFHEYGVGLFLY